MIDTSSDRFKKLPKWIQDEVRRLGRVIKLLEKENNVIRKGIEVDDSDVSIKLPDTHTKQINLPKNTSVTFDMGNGKHIQIILKEDGDKKVVSVFGITGVVLIKPKAANHFQIYCEKF